MAVAIIAVVIIIAVAVARAAMVITPGKGSGKNPKKSSLRKKGGFPSGLLTQKRAQMGVISAPFDTSPA